MDKTLQDHVWKHCLPKEFKEDVKKLYTDALDASNSPHEPDDRKWGNYRVALLEKLFGIHNLTSDAEGEEDEMLHVSRKKLQYFYEKLRKVGEHHAAFALQSLFGSKCLPDELDEDNFAKSEPKPAEPKFKEGDRVRVKGCGYEPNLHKGDIGEILDTNDKEQCFVLFKKSQAWIYADCLEPYTEPTAKNPKESAKTFAFDEPTDTESDDFDRIVNDGFRGHNRLHIAAMAMQGILSNADRMKKYEHIATEPPCEDLTKIVARNALRYADALIKEELKGGVQ